MNHPNEDEELAAFLRELQRDLRKRRFLTCIDAVEATLRAAGAETLDWKSLPPVRGDVTDTLDLVWEVKAADAEQGTVVGYLSTYSVDLGSDMVMPGAYRKSLDTAGETARRHNTHALYPFLWQHHKDDPIGAIVRAAEDRKGLLVTVKLNMSIDHGRQALHGLTNGYMAMSIGYAPTRYDYQGKIRRLHEIDLKEGSAVTWAMNPEARAISGSRGAA